MVCLKFVDEVLPQKVPKNIPESQINFLS